MKVLRNTPYHPNYVSMQETMGEIFSEYEGIQTIIEWLAWKKSMES